MKKYLLIAVCVLVYTVFFATAFAREAYFMPAIGETVVAIAGAERFMTGEDGMLHGYSFEGNILHGFPVVPDNMVITSSPVLVNITGDTSKEIAAIARSEDERYRLIVYSPEPRLLASIDLPAETYYDPIIVPIQNSQLEELFVATVAGEVLQIRYINNNLVSSSVLQLNAPVAISFDSSNRELVVSYPQQAVLDVYGQRQVNWERLRRLDLPVAFLQPVAFDGATYTGVTRNNGMTLINRLDGTASAGFPVDLGSQPVGPVVVADVASGNVGNEFIVTLANGDRKIISTNGRVITSSGISFGETGLDTVDVVERARFTVLKNFVVSLTNGTYERLFSYLSRIKPAFAAYNIIRDGDMEDVDVSAWTRYGAPRVLEKSTVEFINGAKSIHMQTLEGSGGVQQVRLPVDPGRYYRFSFSYKIVQGELRAFFGNNTSNSAFDGVVTILNAPRGSWSNFERLIFVPQNFQGDFRFIMSTRNADVYVDDVILEPMESPPLVLDSDMESSVLTAWLRYGAPPIFEKTAAQAALGRRSIHVTTPGINGGFQQLNVPVSAGQWYRYSFDYILTRGSIRTFLGIRTSNSDFENKVATLARPGNDWQRYSRDFRVPDNFTQSFNVIISSRDAEFYVDNVRIEPINAPAIVMDGDMEAPGTGNWINFSNPGRVEKVNNIVHGGSQSLYVETLPDAQPGQRKLSGAVQQLTLPVTAGRRYRLSFWYRIQGTVHPRLGAGISNEDFELRGFDAAGRPRWPRLTNAAEWTYYEREFVAPVTNDFRLVFALYDAVQFLDDAGIPIGLQDYNIGQLWLDDVRIDAM